MLPLVMSTGFNETCNALELSARCETDCRTTASGCIQQCGSDSVDSEVQKCKADCSNKQYLCTYGRTIVLLNVSSVQE